MKLRKAERERNKKFITFSKPVETPLTIASYRHRLVTSKGAVVIGDRSTFFLFAAQRRNEELSFTQRRVFRNEWRGARLFHFEGA
jgi:hypothetical protein